MEFLFYRWMVDNANSQCRNFAYEHGRVRGLDHKSMKIFLLGSRNLTKFNEITSNIWIGFCNNYSYGSGRYLSSTRNLPFLFYLFCKNQTPDFKHHLKRRSYCSNYHIYTHNNLDLEQACATHRIFRF